MTTAAKVAQRKEEKPELYCSEPRCLWRTDANFCPRHQFRVKHKPLKSLSDVQAEREEQEWVDENQELYSGS